MKIKEYFKQLKDLKNKPINKFFKENKIFLAIIIIALIIGGAIIISNLGEKQSGVELEVENCADIPELPDGVLKLVTKIIDGDTFLIEGGYSVRVLGIDADERDYPCYQAAKDRLEDLILNKEVKLEKGTEDKDQWCRYLRYAFLDNENISLSLVKEGLAMARLSPEDVEYREEIVEAEKQAREDKIGCKWREKEIEEQKTEFQWDKLTSDLIGLKIIGACQAGNYYGKEIIIEGRVVGAYRSKTNTIFLNFEKSYPNHCFVAVIFSSDQYKFAQSPEEYYLNEVVRIRGTIEKYEGKPEIIFKDPSQIEIGK
ncbi:thermonuclease family protein [Patescibacteria group bacterium]|nr:thermonuclease family protein [Patescibacteria group bacterium]